MSFTGKEFNEKYSNYELYKVISEDFTHNNFTYKDGLNIDIVHFNPSGECSAGGLYFTELYKLAYWINCGMYICKVTIPNDSLVYIEQDKFKADKINLDLNNKVLIKDFYAWDDPYFCEIAVQQSHTALRFVRNQTEEICKIAIYTNICSFHYVKEQTEEICKIAIQQYGYALHYVKEQTEDMCKLAVQRDGYLLKYVKEQTEDICKLAVQENGYALKFVKEQTEDICKLAVRRNVNAIRFVKKKTFEIYKLSLYEIYKLSVYENSNVFQYFKRLCTSIYKKFTINSFFRKV